MTWTSEPETSRLPPVSRGPSLGRRSEATRGRLGHKLRGTRGSGTRQIVAALRLGVRGSAEARAGYREKPRTRNLAPTSAQPAPGCSM